MQIMKRYPTGTAMWVSASKFLFWRGRNHVFKYMAACDLGGAGFNLTTGSEPERVSGVRVSADFFRVFGVNPGLGRDFTSEV